jgi:hypothetical protein
MLTPSSAQRLRAKPLLILTLLAASILLPLGPLWRDQSVQLEALQAERRLLDPLSHALALQRSLLAHRRVSEQVLRGRSPLEAERLLCQADVDHGLWLLSGTLSAGLWARALAETNQMAYDWRVLTQGVALRRIDVAESNRAHQLLIEQAVQVMDLLAAQATTASSLHWAAMRPALADAPRSQALQTALLVRTQLLQARQAELQASRAGSGVLALLAWLAAAWLLPRAPRSAPGNDVRRGPGRRTTDGPTQPAALSLQAARKDHPQGLTSRL